MDHLSKQTFFVLPSCFSVSYCNGHISTTGVSWFFLLFCLSMVRVSVNRVGEDEGGEKLSYKASPKVEDQVTGF